MEDDIVGTESLIRGEKVGYCDMCQKPFLAESLVEATSLAAGSDPPEPILVCVSCAEALARNDVPVDLAADDDQSEDLG